MSFLYPKDCICTCFVELHLTKDYQRSIARWIVRRIACYDAYCGMQRTRSTRRMTNDHTTNGRKTTGIKSPSTTHYLVRGLQKKSRQFRKHAHAKAPIESLSTAKTRKTLRSAHRQWVLRRNTHHREHTLNECTRSVEMIGQKVDTQRKKRWSRARVARNAIRRPDKSGKNRFAYPTRDPRPRTTTHYREREK